MPDIFVGTLGIYLGKINTVIRRTRIHKQAMKEKEKKQSRETEMEEVIDLCLRHSFTSLFPVSMDRKGVAYTFSSIRNRVKNSKIQSVTFTQ